MTASESSKLLRSRRKVLAAVGGVAGIAGVGYVGSRSIAREGVVTGRLVIGHQTNDGTVVGTTDIFRGYIDTDGPPDRRFDPDYRQYFPAEPPMTVSRSAHRKLQREFDQVDYALSHDCPDAFCSTPQVSRGDFNNARLGEEVRLLYHSGDNATIIP